MKNLLGILGSIAIVIALMPVRTVAIHPADPPQDKRGILIDSYFEAHNMPLAGKGAEMVTVADRDNIDWRLLPALAVRESSGGLHACGANVFGWNSCHSTFSTVDEAIGIVAANLGGYVTSTASYYEGKTTIGKIHSFNPETIVPGYAASVIEIMGAVSTKEDMGGVVE